MIRKADERDVLLVDKVFDDARRFQRSCGFRQWADGYPGVSNIENDIAADSAYVVEISGSVAGYFFIAYDDPGYEALTGIWANECNFAVIHRLAIDSKNRGKGLAHSILSHAERIAKRGGAKSMRVDTGESNVIMQRLMHSLGYTSMGLLAFPWGDRLAYEKLI